MYKRRHRPRYISTGAPGPPIRKRRYPAPAVLLFLLAGLMIVSWIFLRDLSTQIAVSDAQDIVTKSVNNVVNDIVSANNYDYDYFVTLEKDAAGQVTAVSCNMGRVNSFSSEVLDKVIKTTESGALVVKIPFGNLTGLNILMGRGPEVPVRIIYLTSSKVDFRNELTAAGINQTKHQLDLEVTVNIDVLVPWDTESSSVVTEVLIADTVIVGQVPQTYVNVE